MTWEDALILVYFGGALLFTVFLATLYLLDLVGVIHLPLKARVERESSPSREDGVYTLNDSELKKYQAMIGGKK